MILKKTLSVRFFVPLLFVSGLSAAPRLNLIQTALTVSVPTGTNGPTYTLDTFNIGSGTLNLQASSSVPWLVPTVGTSQVCGLRGGCYPVSIAFQTSSLAAGTYTGTITLSDPNAVDSPQYYHRHRASGRQTFRAILCSIWRPVASTSTTFTTNGPITAKVSNATWLTTSSVGERGQWRLCNHRHRHRGKQHGRHRLQRDHHDQRIVVRARQQADRGVAECHHAAYRASQQQLAFVQHRARSAQAQTDAVAVTDAGQGTLTVSSVTATAASSGTWLTAATVNGGITVTADPTGLSPDNYTGTVTDREQWRQRQYRHPGGAHGCSSRAARRICRRRSQQRNLREWRAAGPGRHRRGVRQSIHLRCSAVGCQSPAARPHWTECRCW